MLYCPRRGEISPKALGLGKDVAVVMGKDVAVVMGKDMALEVGKGPLSPMVMGKEPLGLVQETQPNPETMDLGEDGIV